MTEEEKQLIIDEFEQMGSKTYKEAKLIALKYVKSMELKKISNSGKIVIVSGMCDGFYSIYSNAFCKKHGEYHMVFGEHMTPEVFHEDEYIVVPYERDWSYN